MPFVNSMNLTKELSPKTQAIGIAESPEVDQIWVMIFDDINYMLPQDSQSPMLML